MLEVIDAGTFEAQIHQEFSLSYRDTPVAKLELISVSTHPAAARNADQRMPFSLVFRAKDNATVMDGCFTFHHPAIGQLKDVFINRILPAEPDDRTPHYQVVFN